MKINLRKLRESHGKTQEEFAAMLCCSRRNYCRYEVDGELPERPAKILALIISHNIMLGYNHIKSDCRGVALNKKIVNETIKAAVKSLEEGFQ